MLELEPIDNNGRRCINCGHIRSLHDQHTACECPVCHASYDRMTRRALAGHFTNTRVTSRALQRHQQRRNHAPLQLPASTKNLLLGLTLALGTLITAIILRAH